MKSGAKLNSNRKGKRMCNVTTQRDLDTMIVSHGLWLSGDEQGKQLILHGYNCDSLDFRDANLTGADLTRANLTEADLTNADLTEADLTNADLTNADLTNADLTRANLTRVTLIQANLPGGGGTTCS